MIIQKKTLKNVLFIDIETVPLTKNFHELPESLQHLWKYKSKQFLTDKSNEVTEELAAQFYTEKAGIYADFGKIVCISVGYLSNEKSSRPQLRIKTLQGKEVDILKAFNKMLKLHYNDLDNSFLCGHNIREFHIPFICRRSMVHGLNLPRMLNISGKKPWEVKHLLDTMLLWRFGDFKNYTSLPLLAGALGITLPSDDLEGDQIGKTYWEENDIDRIIANCEDEVITVAKIAMRFAGKPLPKDEQIEIINSNS